MEEPVRVGLVFPRSGQRLMVEVPRKWAQVARLSASAESVVRTERLAQGNAPIAGEDSRRPQ